MIFKFFRSKTTFTIIALKVVTCTPTFAPVTEPPPSQESVHPSSFLEPVAHSLKTSADLNRRHKPVAEPFLLCFTQFPSSTKTKAFSEGQEARHLLYFFLICHSAWYLQSVIRLPKYVAIIDEHCIYEKKKDSVFKLHSLQLLGDN